MDRLWKTVNFLKIILSPPAGYGQKPLIITDENFADDMQEDTQEKLVFFYECEESAMIFSVSLYTIFVNIFFLESESGGSEDASRSY